VPKRARILLADDHSLILTGIQALIADRYEVAGQVEDGRSLVDEALRLRPDLIILDVTMPLLNGIDAARHIKEAWPQAKFLFLTMHADALYLRNALDAGGQGYLLKSSAAEELHDAIDAVLSGKQYLSKTIPAQVKDAVTTAPVRGAKLTDRQREVLQLLAEGRGNKEISAVLNVSIKTVEFHRGQLMQILGVHTVAELTQFAMRLGLIGQGAVAAGN
jgi:DNA-binding NarL/FixJ family response regulator